MLSAMGARKYPCTSRCQSSSGFSGGTSGAGGAAVLPSGGATLASSAFGREAGLSAVGVSAVGLSAVGLSAVGVSAVGVSAVGLSAVGLSAVGASDGTSDAGA